jgi:hypothetical protein
MEQLTRAGLFEEQRKPDPCDDDSGQKGGDGHG